MNQTKIFCFIEVFKEEESYNNDRPMGRQGRQFPMGNQDGTRKLAMGMRTDLNGIDQGTNCGTTAKIYKVGIPLRKPQQS